MSDIRRYTQITLKRRWCNRPLEAIKLLWEERFSSNDDDLNVGFIAIVTESRPLPVCAIPRSTRDETSDIVELSAVVNSEYEISFLFLN